MSPTAPTLETPDGVVATHGLPEVSELDLLSRALHAGSVVSDVALRTAVATAVTAASIPGGALTWGRKERANLAFHADLARTATAEEVFVRPPRGVPVVERLSSSGLPELPGGRARNLQFTSPYVARNPAMRADYARHRRNGVGWAQHWRHDDGPRPTLCVIHGFGAAQYWFNSAFFSLPQFFAQGWDVLLYTLPFHGPRGATRRNLINGSEVFSHGFATFNEAMIHAVHDFRILVDHLEALGVPRIALTGLSLGGYTSAMVATVEDRLDAVIPNAPVTNLPVLLREWVPAGVGIGLLGALHGAGREQLDAALAVHSPLSYPPVIPRERLMIIGGLGDRLAPPQQSVDLWEHWGHPRLHWYRGSHVMHFSRGAYLDEMRELLGPPLSVAA